MVNNKFNSSGMSTSETHYKNKPSPIAMKKVALRDLQNDNGSFVQNQVEISSSLGAKVNGSKLSGTKRSNSLLSSPSSLIQQSFKGIDVNEHIISANGEVNTNLGRRKAFSSNPTASPVTFSPVKSSLPIFTDKSSNVMAAAGSNHFRVPPCLEVPHSVALNGVIDDLRTERLFNLQKLLKVYDETDKKGYLELLHGLPPSELSRLAIKLEKRSMHLSVEEGKEIQRMKDLNILGNLQDNKPG